MSKAEERALEAYPVYEDFYRRDGVARSVPLDINMEKRYYYQRGYEQAEKDILALVESRLSEIIGDAQPKPILRAELQELITELRNEITKNQSHIRD